jgi:recombinational DNA repair protein RecR
MYTPQFSDMASISVRRFAWAISKNMPATVDIMVKILNTIIDPSKVCQLCQDKTKCQACAFSQQVNPEELAVLEAVI